MIQNEDFAVESITIEDEFIQTTTSIYQDEITDSIVVSKESIKDTNRPAYILENIPVFKRKSGQCLSFS